MRPGDAVPGLEACVAHHPMSWVKLLYYAGGYAKGVDGEANKGDCGVK